jgi:hypothetical protein
MSESDRQPPTPAVAQAERRLYPRSSVRVPLELRLEGSAAPLRLETTELSRNGCSVAMAAPLSVSIRVQVTLALGQQPVLVRGRVVTRHPEFGNGIMFLDFAEDGEQRLRAFLEAIGSE